MNAEALIKKFSKQATVKRQTAAGAYVDRKYVQAQPELITIDISIQPLNGEELLNMPEQQRTKQWVRGYTPTQLFTAQQVASKKADMVIDDNNVTYEVQKVETWISSGNNIQPYWKVIMAQVNP